MDVLTVVYRQTGTIDWDPASCGRYTSLLNVMLEWRTPNHRLILPTVQFALQYEPDVVLRARLDYESGSEAVAPVVSAALEHMRAVRDAVALVLPPRPMHSTVMSYLVDTRKGVYRYQRFITERSPPTTRFAPEELRDLVCPVP